MTEMNETFFHALFDNANDGLFVLDRRGLIIYANRRACEMYGYDRDELPGRSIEAVEAESNRHISTERMERLLKGESLIFETEHCRKDGGSISLEVSSRAFRVGDASYIAASFRDITEKKKIQAQLMHFQKMESIGTLAEGVAHEFKNTLTVILSFSQVALQDGGLSSEASKYLCIIEKSAQKASQTVSRLLSFARKAPFEPVPFSINEIIEDTISIFSKLIRKDLAVTTDLFSPMPYVVGDVGQMEQVLMNLLVNARDALPDIGGEISVRSAVVSIASGTLKIPAAVRSGEYVQVSISDTGSGIPEEHVSHIFEPFYTTKAKGEGTGLGLAIVYGIVKEHGGYITVESRAGKGTVFDIYLPISKKKTVASGEGDITRFHGPETILVVDDEISVMEPIRKFLLENGFNVLVYNNPVRCLDYFRANSMGVDLVLTDIMMPEMDGRVLINNLRELKPEVNIIVMTGFNVDLEGVRTEGMLRKPFAPQDVVTLIREVLDKSGRTG